jgi:NDP-sugar pyrophosphorylase family protein
MLSALDLFDFTESRSEWVFEGTQYVWEVLARIPQLVSTLLDGKQVIEGDVMPGAYLGDHPLFVGRGACIEPGVYIGGPAYIAANVVVRHGAYVRSNSVLLDGAILGHASEIKNSILLPGAKAPHFAYVGDSIIGHRANLGAGVRLSNLSITGPSSGIRSTVRIQMPDGRIDTGLRKFGAILGDDVEIGCNAVLNPGIVLGPRSLVYPNVSMRSGVYPADTITKLRQEIEVTERLPPG